MSKTLPIFIETLSCSYHLTTIKDYGQWRFYKSFYVTLHILLLALNLCGYKSLWGWLHICNDSCDDMAFPLSSSAVFVLIAHTKKLLGCGDFLITLVSNSACVVLYSLYILENPVSKPASVLICLSVITLISLSNFPLLSADIHFHQIWCFHFGSISIETRGLKLFQ